MDAFLKEEDSSVSLAADAVTAEHEKQEQQNPTWKHPRLQWVVQEQFWHDLALGKYENCTMAKLQEQAQEKNVMFFSAQKILPVLMFFCNGQSNGDFRAISSSIKSMLRELLSEMPELILPIEITQCLYLVLFDGEDAGACSRRAERYFNMLKRLFALDGYSHLKWVFGHVCRCDQLHSRYRELFVQARNVYSRRSERHNRLAVHQAIEYLHENPAQSCEELADKVFLNPDYLTKLFKKETGQTLIAYATALRLDEAKNLLEHTTLHIGEIASRLSYHNFSYFSKMFKEKTGVTPQQYRKGVR